MNSSALLVMIIVLLSMIVLIQLFFIVGGYLIIEPMMNKLNGAMNTLDNLNGIASPLVNDLGSLSSDLNSYRRYLKEFIERADKEGLVDKTYVLLDYMTRWYKDYCFPVCPFNNTTCPTSEMMCE